MGRGAPVRRLSGAAAGARGSIPIPSEPPLAAETGHEKRADMPNQHLGWNSVTRRPLAPPRPDWPVRRGLPSNPSATATRGRRPSSPRPTLRAISARIVIAITRLLRRPARCALPARLPRRFSALAVVESGQRGEWLHRGNGCSVKVGKGAERKVKNHFIDHSYHFIPNALARAPRALISIHAHTVQNTAVFSTKYGCIYVICCQYD